jgi:hypothetical protein
MSKVPKEMGEKVQQELQKALDQWTDHVSGGACGAYHDPEFQKIEIQKKEKK